MKELNDPVELLEEISEKIVSFEANKKWLEFYRDQQLSRLKNDLMLLLSLIKKDFRILEVGSNPPFLLATLTEMGFDALGVDVNPESFSNTIQAFDLRMSKVDVERESLPFPSESFDLVIFTEVFEHLRIDPIFTVSEIQRVLREDGTLVLETPNLYSLKGIYNFLIKGRAYACCTNNLYNEFKSVQTMGFFGHIREYTFQEVSLFLKEVGFKKHEICYSGGGRQIWTKLFFSFAPFLRPRMTFIATK